MKDNKLIQYWKKWVFTFFLRETKYIQGAQPIVEMLVK